MRKILMILTSHRLDCFKLCMDCLISGGSIYGFDHVVLLLNGVTGLHQRYITKLMHDHSDIPWDTVSGPRGRGRYISDLQNQCVERYPDALYFKIDEDTFVSSDWHMGLYKAYQQFRDDDKLSLITPVIPNNALGCYYLLNRFPELKDYYESVFKQPLTPECDGPVWLYPQIALWVTRQFLSLQEANRRLRREQQEDHFPPAQVTETTLNKSHAYLMYDKRFSINCICYDYRHWQEIGGVPEEDEVGWGDWIAHNSKRVYLCTEHIVHHYSFFVQQNWLDRTSLLEDIRKANIPNASFVSPVHRFVRIAKQIPNALHKRLKSS